jgi:HEAT repeat protein
MPQPGRPDVDKLETKRDVDGLIKALSYAPDWAVRKDAAEALGRIGDLRAYAPVLEAFDDPRPEVRDAAGRAGLALARVKWADVLDSVGRGDSTDEEIKEAKAYSKWLGRHKKESGKDR